MRVCLGDEHFDPFELPLLSLSRTALRLLDQGQRGTAGPALLLWRCLRLR